MISAGSLEAVRRSASSPSSSGLSCRRRASSNACWMTLACSSGGRPSISSITLVAVTSPTLAGRRNRVKPEFGLKLPLFPWRPLGQLTGKAEILKSETLKGGLGESRRSADKELNKFKGYLGRLRKHRVPVIPGVAEGQVFSSNTMCSSR